MRLHVAILALAIACVSGPAFAQWTPRKITRAPISSGPARQRGPVRSRRVNTAGPITRQPVTPRGSRAVDATWQSAGGSNSIGYKAFDEVSSTRDWKAPLDHTTDGR